jgi:hypothetical protein
MKIALKPFNRVIMSLLIILGVVGVSHAEIPFDDAVGIWLFDEGKGDTAKDTSDAGNDAKLEKSPEWVKGKFGQALKFNGKDNCVQTEQKLLDGLEEFTIVAWINTDNVVGGRIGLVGQNDSPEFGINPAGTIALWTPNGGTVGHPYPGKDGEWHHVAGVADDDGKKVYVDGDVAKGGAPGNHGSSNFNVNIGGCGIWDGTGNWFSGAMDEVAIFHTALDEDQIIEIMETGFATILAVEARGKLPITWGKVKALY